MKFLVFIEHRDGQIKKASLEAVRTAANIAATLGSTVIAVSFGTVFYKAFTKQIPWIVALPFALNLIANVAFTPIQFGLKNNLLASADILLVLGTLVWALFAIYSFGLTLHIETGAPTYAWIVYANVPYLLWVAFATTVQFGITYLNR